MTQRQRLLAAVLVSVSVPLCGAEARSANASQQSRPAEVSNTLARLPLSFEPNYGQSGCEIQFLSRAPGYLLQLTATGMRMIVRGSSPDPRGPKAPARETTSSQEPAVAHALRFTWLGANARAETSTEAALPGTVNYLKGSDSSKWRTSIPTFERVRYQDMYPGIDLLYYGNARQLEYDLIVAPGADPDVIRMSIEGAETVLTKSGDLDLILSDGRALQLRAPVIYQQRGGEKHPIEGRYRLAHRDGVSEIAFDIAAYDPALPLVIDPLVYSTFLGGSSQDLGYGIAVNAANEAFVTGWTVDELIDFPTTAGAFDTLHNGSVDAFVTRLNSTGTALLYSTFLGGSLVDSGRGIAVNAANEAFLTGYTESADFPTTAGAFDVIHGGGHYYAPYDAFVTRISPSGSALVYSTFLGGGDNDYGYGIAVNAANEAFVTGFTSSADFPTTAGAFDTTYNGIDVFVTRLNAAGSALVYSTFLGGSAGEVGQGIAVNAADEAFVTGFTVDAFTDFPTTAGAFDTTHNGGLWDVFVTRLNAGGTALLYSTFLGGGYLEEGQGIAVNGAGEAFVTGHTESADFPTTAGAFDTTRDGAWDAFVIRLNARGTALLYSTLLGGSGPDFGYGIAVNAASQVFVTGSTYDDVTDFPTTAGAFAPIHNGSWDAFVTRLNARGTALLHSTFLGGSSQDSGYDIAVNAANEAFLTGHTPGAITDFPTTAGAFDTTHNGSEDVFVTRLAMSACDINPTALGVDGNGVIEAGERVEMTPSWSNDGDVTLNVVGNLSNFTGPSSGSLYYIIIDGAGSYGSVAPGATAAASDNYVLIVTVPKPRPLVHWDAGIVETLETNPSCPVSPKTWTLHLGDSFSDVGRSYLFYREVETLLHNNVTLGCGDGTRFCTNDPNSRLAMAAFIARSELGSDAAVPVSGTVGTASYNCTSGGNSLYSDVAPTSQFCPHVHYIASQNITSGCTATTYCPSQNVTRLQMAIFLARARAGSDTAVPTAYTDPVTLRSYDLPNGSRAFTDLVGNTFEKHANYLWALGITNGCTATTFCPSALLTRGQMAKFLVGTYDMLLYKP